MIKEKAYGSDDSDDYLCVIFRSRSIDEDLASRSQKRHLPSQDHSLQIAKGHTPLSSLADNTVLHNSECDSNFNPLSYYMHLVSVTFCLLSPYALTVNCVSIILC